MLNLSGFLTEAATEDDGAAVEIALVVSFGNGAAAFFFGAKSKTQLC